jgi:two-component system OmpR family sensor kinase
VTLRLKLPLVLIAFVIAGLAVSAVFTYTSLSSFLFQRLDQQLDPGAGFVIAAINAQAGGGGYGDGDGGPQTGPHEGPLPGGTFGEVLDAGGNVIAGPVRLFGVTNLPAPALPSKLPATGQTGSDPFTTGSVGGSSLRYRVIVQDVQARPTGAHATLVVAVPLRDIDQTLTRLRVIEGVVAAAVLVILGLLSWWLVRRELRPLEDMGVTAGAIAAGELSRRVPAGDPRTEVGRLGVALNGMLTQIEVAFAERRASEDRLRRFLADASHELRTPLTSIRGYAELFRRGARDRTEDLEKSMRRIEEEAARMGVLVEDLLLLARLDQNRALLREPIDLAALAADAVEDARAADPDRRISLDLPGTPVVAVVDEARLRQVAGNLLSNALFHTPPGTPVTVRVAEEGPDAVLEVADQGPGLTPEAATKVFEPFFRSDPSRDRATGGAGLGLSIVSAIAEAHGGRVEVAATPGGGATFRVVIPREAQAPDGAADRGEGAPAAAGSAAGA